MEEITTPAIKMLLIDITYFTINYNSFHSLFIYLVAYSTAQGQL
jgi:hypothetical protein